MSTLEVPEKTTDHQALLELFNKTLEPIQIHERLDATIAAIPIPSEIFNTIQTCARLFLSSCLQSKVIIQDDMALVHQLENVALPFDNITPNGKIMPRAVMAAEYNILLRALLQLAELIDPQKRFIGFRAPTLRFKASVVSNALLARNYPTEHPHMESWVGHPSNALIAHIPIIGDSDNNYLQFYKTPPKFNDTWARPVNNFNDQANILNKFLPLDLVPQKGVIYLFSAHTGHMTQRRSNSGARISCELVGIMPNTASQADDKETNLNHYDHLFERASCDGLESSLWIPSNDLSGYVNFSHSIPL